MARRVGKPQTDTPELARLARSTTVTACCKERSQRRNSTIVLGQHLTGTLEAGYVELALLHDGASATPHTRTRKKEDIEEGATAQLR